MSDLDARPDDTPVVYVDEDPTSPTFGARMPTTLGTLRAVDRVISATIGRLL